MKSKKLLLGSLSAMALVATPIATVVSCGGNGSAATAAEKFTVANYIKEIKADDGGLVLDTNEAGINKLYISKADIAKGKTFKLGKKTVKIPAAVKAGTKVKVSITNEKGEESKTEVTPVAAAVGQYVFHKNQVVADLATATSQVALALITTGGKGIYKFDFKADSLKDGKTPTLTDDAKKAFEKLFTDAGFTLTGLAFSASKVANVQVITPTFTLAKKTTTPAKPGKGTTTGAVQGDLAALQTALGGATVTLSGTGVVAKAPVADIKTAGTAMASADLLSAINAKNGTAAMAGVNLTDALVKEDMHITFEVNTASVAAVAGTGAGNATGAVSAVNGTATITISAGSLTPVTVVVTLVVA